MEAIFIQMTTVKAHPSFLLSSVSPFMLRWHITNSFLFVTRVEDTWPRTPTENMRRGPMVTWRAWAWVEWPNSLQWQQTGNLTRQGRGLMFTLEGCSGTGRFQHTGSSSSEPEVPKTMATAFIGLSKILRWPPKPSCTKANFGGCVPGFLCSWDYSRFSPRSGGQRKYSSSQPNSFRGTK